MTRDGPIYSLHRDELGRRIRRGSTVAAVLLLSAFLPTTLFDSNSTAETDRTASASVADYSRPDSRYIGWVKKYGNVYRLYMVIHQNTNR